MATNTPSFVFTHSPFFNICPLYAGIYFLEPTGLTITSPFIVEIAATTFALAENAMEKQKNNNEKKFNLCLLIIHHQT